MKITSYTNQIYTRYAWALLRISLGWIFLWAFFDKVFGFGFATCRDKVLGTVQYGCSASWIEGGSPTYGFLSNATKGPFVDFFQLLAGSAVVDFLFMFGLLGIGISLLLGIVVRIGATAGILMMMLMYLSVLPPGNNPFMDDHIVYAIALFGIRFADAGTTWGLGRWWSQLSFVRRYPILQ
ncbi:MAG: hypothetical protein Q8P93_03080 [bacterium]|nr:hypothetical protein [bacterium]